MFLTFFRCVHFAGQVAGCRGQALRLEDGYLAPAWIGSLPDFAGLKGLFGRCHFLQVLEAWTCVSA